MKILFDIGHPAHVHYFRNLIKLLKDNEHQVLVIARNRYPIFELLDNYGIKYYSRGKGSDHKIGKLLYLIKGNIYNLYRSIVFKPDLLMSHGGTYTAFLGWLLGKKSITTEDTEHAINSHRLAIPFTTFMMTPDFFNKDLGKKQIHFNSFMELAYLYPKYFYPDLKVLKKYELENKRFVLFRFVNWNAHHDNISKELSPKEIVQIVQSVSKHALPIISSEGNLPNALEKYELKIDAEDFHSLLFYATLHIGEGATTASESALLGTPALYINPLKVSNIELQERFGLAKQLIKKEDIIMEAKNILNMDRDIFKQRLNELMKENIDFTEYMFQFINNQIYIK